MRHSTPRSSSDRIVNSASRSTISSTDDSHLFQQVGLNVQSGEQHQDVEHVQPYGLVSNVQPPTQGATGSNTAAESFIVYMSSDRSHPVSLVSGDRRYRMMNLAPGEVALHDDQGQQLHLTRKGMVTTVLNSQSHTHQIMPDKSSAMNKDQQQRGSSGELSLRHLSLVRLHGRLSLRITSKLRSHIIASTKPHARHLTLARSFTTFGTRMTRRTQRSRRARRRLFTRIPSTRRRVLSFRLTKASTLGR